MAVYLVTGGAGFIGSHIVDALLDRGDTVRVLDNLVSGYLKNLAHVQKKIEFFEGSIRDNELLYKATEGVDCIFHLAAMVSVPQSMVEPEEAELNNAMGMLNVLQAAKVNRVRRVVLSSTCAIYGDKPTLPKIETMYPHPQSPYAISKFTAENYCLLFHELFGVETVILRYFNVFGPRQNPSSAYSGVISIFVNRISQGVSPFIYGDGNQTRDFVYVGDVVQANLLAIEVPQAAGQIFNICTEQQTSIKQLFDSVRQIFKVDLEPVYKPPRSGDIVLSYGDSTKAQSVLGWSPKVTFEEGLKRLTESI